MATRIATTHQRLTRAGDWWDLTSQRLITAGVVALVLVLAVIVAALIATAVLHKLGRI